MKWWPALLAALSLAGCAAVGPNFTAPPAPTVKAYAGAGDASPTLVVLAPEARVAGPWWRGFGSAKLDGVMARALAGNQTVAEAEATLEEVRAQARRERAVLDPAVRADASIQRERINTAVFGFAGFPSPTISLFSIGPSVSYDLDLAGGGWRRIEAAGAQALAQARRADAAYLTLTGNVALEAVRIAALRATLDTLQDLVADDRQSIDILRKAEAAGGEARSAGLGGELRLEQDLALAPPVAAELAQARHALALLVGEAPSQWTGPDFDVADFRPPATIPVVIPSILVQRRPDIQAAQADLHAETALIGVETARLYPDVRLAAGLTQEAPSAGSLPGFGATAYSFGPQLGLPIFDGGAIRADRRAAQARARAALARYRQAVTAAFVQVSDVLSSLAEDDNRLASLDRAEATARASLDDTRAAYRLGGAPLAAVVNAERSWRRASLERLDAVGRRLEDIVALYGATAADWRTNR